MQRTKAFHPFFLVAYLVLFAYAHNFEYAPPPGVILRLLAFAVGAMALLWAVLRLVTRDTLKSAVAASGLTLLFVSYGHVKNVISAWWLGFHVFSLHVGVIKLSLLALVTVAVIAGACLRRVSPAAMRTATVALNAAASWLIAFGIAHLFTVELGAHSTPPHGVALAAQHRSRTGTTMRGADRPDIYYIILDTYGRADVLRDLYGYDNRDFIEWLREKGFYVADRSRSNYSQTMLSVASSLNLSYLDSGALRGAANGRNGRLPVKFNWAASQLFTSPTENQRLPLALMIQNSQVVSTLKTDGYRFAAFTSGYGGVQFPDADLVRRASGMAHFEESVGGTTPLPDVFDRPVHHPDPPRPRR